MIFAAGPSRVPTAEHTEWGRNVSFEQLPSVPSRLDRMPLAEEILTVSSETTDSAVILTAIGEIDILTVDRLRSAVSEALRAPVGHPVVVDLTRVSYIGSCGTKRLVEAAAEAKRQEEPLRIVVGHQGHVVRPLQITGLDQVFALYETLRAALAV